MAREVAKFPRLLAVEKKLELPITVGMMKSPSVSEKVKIDPATIPGSVSGRMIRRKV